MKWKIRNISVSISGKINIPGIENNGSNASKWLLVKGPPLQILDAPSMLCAELDGGHRQYLNLFPISKAWLRGSWVKCLWNPSTTPRLKYYLGHRNLFFPHKPPSESSSSESFFFFFSWCAQQSGFMIGDERWASRCCVCFPVLFFGMRSRSLDQAVPWHHLHE